MGLLEMLGLLEMSGLVAWAGLLVLEGLEAMVRTVVTVARSRSVLVIVLGKVRVKVNDMRLILGYVAERRDGKAGWRGDDVARVLPL
jgi:hypothetical protein